MRSIRLILLTLFVCAWLSAANVSTPKVVITADQAKQLFGARAAKLVLVRGADDKQEVNPNAIFLLDFAKQPLALQELAKDTYYEFDKGYSDPFISPDGTRVVYGTVDKAVVIVDLTSGKRNVVIAEGYDAHWWVHPKSGDEYLIYSNVQSSRNIPFEGNPTLIQNIKKGGIQADGAAKTLIADYRMVTRISFVNYATPWILRTLFVFVTPDAGMGS